MEIFSEEKLPQKDWKKNLPFINDRFDEILTFSFSSRLSEDHIRIIESFLRKYDLTSEIIWKLETSKDINVKDENWKTVLIHACYNWDFALVSYVLHLNAKNFIVLWKWADDWTKVWKGTDHSKAEILKRLYHKFRI